METREEIFDAIQELWYECLDRNIGQNEAELDFMETLADWIYNRG